MPAHPEKKRIEILDIYRGFAVLGIFVVNIEIMNCIFMNQDSFSSQWNSFIDIIVVKILQLFFYSKFFPIFSFLFGLGITFQALKFIDSRGGSTTFFIRRMFILFLLGVLHILLLWPGDVIHLYAILGMFTILLLKLPDRLILISSLVILIFPFYEVIAEFIFQIIDYDAETYLKNYSSTSIVETIRHGSYVEGMLLRISEYKANIPVLFVYLAPIAFSMFLLGMYFGKKKYIEHLKELILKIKKPTLYILIISNLYRISFLFWLPHTEIYRNTHWRPLFLKLMVVTDLLMGLGYLWILGYIWYYTKYSKTLNFFKYPGRMALTNYILQSFIGLLLFSSVGLSLYETLSPLMTFSIAILTFVFQVFFSRIWLNCFQFGPLEWLWRCISYKKLLPIKR